MPVRSASPLRAGGWMVPSEGKLTPPQFITAGVFMCRHIHREGNGGPFLLRCTAGSTVATCVHRIGHMAHSTQLPISAVHAHIKATEITVLMLSLSTGSKTLLPHTHTHTHTRDSSGCRHSEHTKNPPAQPPHPHHQIHFQESQPPHSTHTEQAPTTTATRNCQHALQKEHSNPLQCASCVCCCCVPAETQSKAEKREQSMWKDAQTKTYSGGAWQK
ncbi:hypothetical protein ECC02_009948 [Trypanosoma cruzi]|uniref:Uncharacterized protein n=1 Tax=Trypanosoma cruzi TaxID=5693 RepID=A0A7J6XT32_TRYCR|nr:hypothetical protein ECC02_009948 [Trypanosoma cruzi]